MESRMKTQSKRTYRKWGGVYFVLFSITVLIFLSILYGFFNTAQGSKNEQPKNTFYEGEVNKVAIYTFETSTNETCTLARRRYEYTVAISCNKKDSK